MSCGCIHGFDSRRDCSICADDDSSRPLHRFLQSSLVNSTPPKEPQEPSHLQRQGWTPDEAKAIALKEHPECAYAKLDMRDSYTTVVKLWRNQECHDAGDPPRHKIGFRAPTSYP